MNAPRRILLTGATGYVGGRLLPRLEAAGHAVRCLARRPEFLRDRVGPRTEVFAGDVLDRDSLDRALAGVDTAYYLVHALGASAEAFDAIEQEGARHFAAAARAAGVRRIIYLGGLGDDDALSAHLESRHRVGEILRREAAPAEVLEFRASIIIGPGSASFEMIRALVERLPAMVTPRWVRAEAQPIAIRDVLAYLEEALALPPGDSRVHEIGGRDRMSYGDLMLEYARQRGLRRLLIPVPVLTPRLSSLWLGLVTPLYARVGRRLVDSIRHATVVRDRSAAAAFAVVPVGTAEAIRLALAAEDAERAASSWRDAVSSATTTRSWGGVRFGNRLVDARVRRAAVPASVAFAAVRRIGGRTGWYYATWLWRVRGWMDLLVGGVGMRRGRRDPERLRVGEALDCWRVEALEEGGDDSPSRLLLAAEMRLPGRAWLEFEVVPDPARAAVGADPGDRVDRADGAARGATIRQTAVFDPVGLLGLFYWYAVWPLHQLVFAGMLRGVAGAATRAAAGDGGLTTRYASPATSSSASGSRSGSAPRATPAAGAPPGRS